MHRIDFTLWLNTELGQTLFRWGTIEQLLVKCECPEGHGWFSFFFSFLLYLFLWWFEFQLCLCRARCMSAAAEWRAASSPPFASRWTRSDSGDHWEEGNSYRKGPIRHGRRRSRVSVPVRPGETEVICDQSTLCGRGGWRALTWQFGPREHYYEKNIPSKGLASNLLWLLYISYSTLLSYYWICQIKTGRGGANSTYHCTPCTITICPD